MKDEKKFRVLMILATFLVVCILSYSILGEYLMRETVDYLKRRIYYEKVISKRGLLSTKVNTGEKRNRVL